MDLSGEFSEMFLSPISIIQSALGLLRPLISRSWWDWCFLFRFFDQIILDVPSKECVITWDFDILKCDVVFSLYHTDNKLGE